MNEKNEQLEKLETDPQFDALLDKALSPEKLPDGLVDNIVAATEGKLSTEQQPSVIARIGSSSWLRVAAVIVAVVTLAVVAVMNNQQPGVEEIVENPVKTDPVVIDIPMTALADDVQSYVDAVDQYAATETSIDSDLDLLEMDIALAGGTGLWDDTADPFNDTISEWDYSSY